MAIEWPADFPNPNSDDYSLSPGSTVIESNMDDGSVLSRRRYTSVPTVVQVSWTFTDDQFARFETFFKRDLIDGLMKFNTPLGNGRGINRVEAQFVQSDGKPYRAAPRPQSFDSWIVSATLRTVALPVSIN